VTIARDLVARLERENMRVTFKTRDAMELLTVGYTGAYNALQCLAAHSRLDGTPRDASKRDYRFWVDESSRPHFYTFDPARDPKTPQTLSTYALNKKEPA
jgi:hypothetical protein